MTTPIHDAVIVGARCAGASLATFLARSGASVLMIDRAALPSDYVLSTHTLHPAGMAVLDELGLGDAVRDVSPAMTVLRMRKDASEACIELAPHQREYCPRRERLDGLLQSAAVAAGAELRDRTRVVALLRDGDRVAGVRTRSSDGREHDVRARLVIGADGRSSTVASLVGAEDTFAYEGPRAMYWGYFQRPASLAREMYVGFSGGGVRVVFHTDDDRVLVGSLPAVTEVHDAVHGWRKDPLAALRRDLRCDPYTAQLELGEPHEAVRGVIKSTYYVRRAWGPGWALIGDAGMHKEFVSGDGMSEAFIQSKNLAAAMAEGTARALERFWYARDVDSLAGFFFGQDQGAAGARLALDVVALGRIARDPELRARVARTLEHGLSPYDVVGPARVLAWTARAAIGGNPRVLSDFLVMGKRRAAVERAVAEARARLAEFDRRAASDQPERDARPSPSARAA